MEKLPAILFDHEGQIHTIAQKEFTQHFPKPGWVEHNPNEIWSSQISVAAEVVAQEGISGEVKEMIGNANV